MKDCVGPGITKCYREGDDLGFVESDWMGTPTLIVTITAFAITDSVFPWVVFFPFIFFLSFFFCFPLTLLYRSSLTCPYSYIPLLVNPVTATHLIRGGKL